MKLSDIESAREICLLIQALTALECESVEILNDNPDGPPDCGICLIGIEPEDYEEFRGDSVLRCLVEAAIFRKRLVICGEYVPLSDLGELWWL